MKKIVVFGGKGGLGTKLVPLLKEKYEVISLCSKDVDVTNPKEVNDFFNKNHVDIVLNMSGKKYDVFLNSITEDDYKKFREAKKEYLLSDRFKQFTSDAFAQNFINILKLN